MREGGSIQRRRRGRWRIRVLVAALATLLSLSCTPAPALAVATVGDGTAASVATAHAAAWPAFRGAGAMGVTLAPTPTAGGAVAWSFSPDATSTDARMAGFTNRSEVVIVGDEACYVVGSRLYGIDLATGVAERSCELADRIDYTCRPVYDEDDGLLLVPLRGGALEAVDVEAFAGVWSTPMVDEDQQSLSTPLLANGRVYLATTDGGSPAKSGHLLCIDVATHQVVWDEASQETGYYWTGAAMTSRGLLIGDDAGDLTLRDPADGHAIASVALGGTIRATTALSADGSKAYVMTREDGTLHVVDVESMAEVGRVKVCDWSTSTPAVAGSTLYVGGLASQAGGVYAVDVSDPTDPYVAAAATSFGTGATVGEVKASPLVSVQDGGTYVYFTANDANGALYVWRAGDASFRLLVQPDQRQWCLASPVCDAEGSLYYANDSSVLFKVSASEVPVPQPGRTTDNGEATAKGGTTGGGTTGSSGTRTGSSPTGASGTTGTGVAASGTPAAGVGGSPSVANGGAAGTSGDDLVGMSEDDEADDTVDDADDLDAGSDDEAPSGDANEAATESAPDDEAAEPSRAVPVWPVVGIVSGLVAIVLAVAWPRLRGRLAAHQQVEGKGKGGASDAKNERK